MLQVLASSCVSKELSALKENKYLYLAQLLLIRIKLGEGDDEARLINRSRTICSHVETDFGLGYKSVWWRASLKGTQNAFSLVRSTDNNEGQESFDTDLIFLNNLLKRTRTLTFLLLE